MKIIGITGGVGAGKSCVLAALKKMCNCDIVMADDVARQIMEKGGILTAKAYELFGENAYNEDGTLNKELLSGVIYNNPSVKKLIPTKKERQNSVRSAFLSGRRPVSRKLSRKQARPVPGQRTKTCNHLTQQCVVCLVLILK